MLEAGRPVSGCMFSVEMLAHILCEKYQYHRLRTSKEGEDLMCCVPCHMFF